MSRARKQIPPRGLRELWAKIPPVKDCKGLCANSCGPIECSSEERRLIEERTGRPLEARPPGLTCSMLKNGRCTVYSIRPVICRLWGAVESMPCPQGCRPERMLSDREGLEIMVAAMRLAGDDPDRVYTDFIDALPEDAIAKMREWALGAPDLGGAIRNRNKAKREFVDSLNGRF
jgi:hypothetical protein